MMLITLQQAKDQLRLTHDAEDTHVESLIAAASAAVVTYLKDFAETFLDTSGQPTPITDTGGDPIDYDVPDAVKMAVKIQVAEWFKNREGQTENDIGGVLGIPHGYGYLSRAVVAILYPYRTPTLR